MRRGRRTSRTGEATIARKEYTRGEVIGIMGHVVGKSIEAVGLGLLFGARALSMITRGLFLVGGKQVDMVNTLKEMASDRKGARIGGAIEDGQYTIIEQPGAPVAPVPDNEAVMEGISLVRMALDYGNRAYCRKMLPLEEILRVDHQAQTMARAVQQYLQKHRDPHLRRAYGKLALAMVHACSQFESYHRTGNDQLRLDAVRMLEGSGLEACEAQPT